MPQKRLRTSIKFRLNDFLPLTKVGINVRDPYYDVLYTGELKHCPYELFIEDDNYYHNTYIIKGRSCLVDKDEALNPEKINDLVLLWEPILTEKWEKLHLDLACLSFKPGFINPFKT